MNSCCKRYRQCLKKNEKGFTLIEMLIATAMSLVLLSLIMFVFEQQSDTFNQQNEISQMQTNSRATMDLLARLVQNSGYNVTRGTRFLAASDHYLSAVFDENDDGVITNNEVFTLAVSNATGTATENITINPYFDADNDGTVEATETGAYTISNVLSSLPLNLYHYRPDVGGSTSARSLMAENIENVIIRYYDKNNDPLPSGVALDGNGEVPLPFTVPSTEWNDIRKVTIEVVARSNKEDPRGSTKSGTYDSGSIAAVVSGGTSYSDKFIRATYSTVASPRNLVSSAWGKIQMSPNPAEVTCPTASMVVTADLVDQDGIAISGATMSFSASQGSVSPTSSTTDSSGAASTTITYDWARPSTTSTVSASTLVTVGSENFPVYSAMPVGFVSDEIAYDFDDGTATGWNNVGLVDFDVDTQTYKTSATGIGEAINGCTSLKDYNFQTKFRDTGTGMAEDDYAGLFLRYTDSDNHYLARIKMIGTGPSVPTVELVKVESSTETVLASDTAANILGAAYALDTDYILKAQVEGTTLNVNLWADGGTEPTDWAVTATDAVFTSGQVGLTTSVDTNVFDDVVLEATSQSP